MATSRPPVGLYCITVLVLFFLVCPILIIFPVSFSSGELLILPKSGYSLRWYEDFFTSSRWLQSLKNSFIVGIATMILATMLGTLAAFGIYLGQFRGKAILLTLLTLPMVTPVIVTAIALYFALASVGLGGSLLGLVIAHTLLSVPYVLFTVLASLQNFDTNLLRAAASLGASPLTGMRRVVLPLIAPGVITGALFAFVTSFDELVIALFITSPGHITLPRQMFAGLREFLSPTLAVAAVLLVMLSLLLLALNEWVTRKAQKRGVTVVTNGRQSRL